MLNRINDDPECALYSIASEQGTLSHWIASTPESRKILNDPFVVGVEYTRLLRQACTRILKALSESTQLNISEDFNIRERESVVLHILRGGLNFGLREALADAYGWNQHGAAFISAQRAKLGDGSNDWYITESSYNKVMVPRKVSVIFGDVVATGTSLKHALNEVLNEIEAQEAQLQGILFFTIGDSMAERILAAIDAECKQRFPAFKGSMLVYLEGRFPMASADTTMTVQIEDTDLLRKGALMADEFVESQYANPAYPLERCVIYDAGSRAFWLPEYFEDLKDYWTKTLALAEDGMTFEALLEERAPQLDATRFSHPDLAGICRKQLSKLPSD